MSYDDGFADCFGEIGCLKRTHHIEVDEKVEPTIVLVRKIPFSLKPKLEKELQRMMKLDVIKPVNHPTEWVNGGHS